MKLGKLKVQRSFMQIPWVELSDWMGRGQTDVMFPIVRCVFHRQRRHLTARVFHFEHLNYLFLKFQGCKVIFEGIGSDWSFKIGPDSPPLLRHWELQACSCLYRVMLLYRDTLIVRRGRRLAGLGYRLYVCGQAKREKKKHKRKKQSKRK